MAGDPWVIQPHEHAKFAEHFRALGPAGGMLSGEQAKRFMLQSQLPPPVLGQIWSLADCNADGKLDLKEFSIACKIINLKLHGVEIPKVLPPSLLASLTPTGPPKQQFPAPAKPPIPPMPSIPPQPLIGGLPPQPPTQSLLGDFGQPSIPARPTLPIIPDLISGVKPMVQPITAQPMGHPLTPPQLIPNQPIIPPQPMLPMASQPLIPSQPLANQPLLSSQLANQPLISGLPQTPLVPTSPPQPLVAGTTLGSLVSSPPKPVNTVAGSIQPVTSTPIAPAKAEELSKPASLAGSLVASAAGSPTEPLGLVSPPALAEWAVPQPQKLKYTQLFNATDLAKTGWVSGVSARSIMLQSRLPQAALAQIWALADLDADGRLGCEEFVLAMYLCEKATQGEPVPAKLPPELIPPTFRRQSVTSISSAHSYEARRRENMARGQAELERRRDQLAEAQQKEKAERERKEREEAEKRERLRLEQQKKEQEELMRKQKEEQEKREAARKEMERQCQLEWEKKRTRELETLRTEEQSRVLALKARSQALAGELSAAAARAGSLAKDIRGSRTAVAAAKCTIDGMR